MTTAAALTSGTATPTPSFADATAAGQVLMWAPEGAGDFAHVAWVIAGVLGNGSGVSRLDMGWAARTRAVHVHVTTTCRSYVLEAAERHGLALYAPDESYANASGMLGEIYVNVIWIAPTTDTEVGDTEAGDNDDLHDLDEDTAAAAGASPLDETDDSPDSDRAMAPVVVGVAS